MTMGSYKQIPSKLRQTSGFYQKVLIEPVLASKPLLLAIAGSLVLLSVAQSSFVFLVKGFLLAFFGSHSSEVLPISELIPSSLQPYLSALVGIDFANLYIARSQLVVAVPTSIVIAGVSSAVASYLYQSSQEKLTLRMADAYRQTLFAAILRLPFLESAKRSSADWMTVVVSDAYFLQSRASELMTGFIKDVALIIGSVIALWFVYWPAAVFFVFLAPVIAMSMGRAGKRISYFAEQFQK
jgi:ABC-type multidrug transport system fused ATPase/permease subunit